GGQEMTITSFHTTLLHQGMIIVGLPYAFPGLLNMDEITGGTPYGATTLAKGDGSRQPRANELDRPRYQGKHLAPLTAQRHPTPPPPPHEAPPPPPPPPPPLCGGGGPRRPPRAGGPPPRGGGGGGGGGPRAPALHALPRARRFITVPRLAGITRARGRR